MLSRRGASLAEALVATVLGAVVLSVALGSLLRQQRTTTELVAAGQGGAQLRIATAVVAAHFSLASPTSADLVRGEARDTALQFRAVVAAGLACDSMASPGLGLEPGDTPGVASQPRTGDSLWWYAADSARWLGREVSDGWTTAGPCAGAPAATAVVRMRLAGADPIPPAVPVRVTRQVRLSVYRAGDGTWQLGLREWSDATHAFAAPQPLAGPLLRAAPDGGRSAFRYFDAAGAELAPAERPADHDRIARMRFVAVLGPMTGAPAGASPPRDSVDVAVHPGPER